MAHPTWHTDGYPELRSAPPWVMQEMMAAQPSLAAPVLGSAPAAAGEIAEVVRAVLAAGGPVTVTGCGTSEHGAHAVAALIAAATPLGQRALVRARPAFSAALEPADGLCLAVSHDGGTRATELAMAAARAAGATTVAITHDPQGTVAAAADHVLVTPLHDASWCHTVAYTSAILAGASIAASVGQLAAEPAAAEDLVRRAVALDAGPVAERLADRRVLLCAGAGVDHVTARELALKIAEGARMPTVALELETVLHGQLAGHEAADGLLLVALAAAEGERVARRARHVVEAAAAIGIPVAGVLAGRYDEALPPELTPAGRLVLDELPQPERLAAPLAALLGGAGALQALTLALAHARGTNPDLIRREETPYRQAAQVAEEAGDW